MSLLDQRLQRLEAIEAIRALKMAYAEAADRQDTNSIVKLFYEPCTWDGGEIYGRHEGKEAIRSYFDNLWDKLTFSLHFMTNDQIEIASSGQSASGTWHLWAPSTLSDEPLWIAGFYHDEYRKVDGRWFFSLVRLMTELHTPFDSGWAQTKFGAEYRQL